MRFATWVFAFALLVSSIQAQDLGDLFQLDSSFAPQKKAAANVSALLAADEQQGVVKLAVTIKLPEGANTYSQDPSFAKPTRFRLTNAAGWTPLDDGFTPDHPPKNAFDKSFGKEVEKFIGEVTFTRRYLAPSGVDVKAATLSGVVEFLMCDDELCTPQSIEFTAQIGAPGPEVVAPTESPSGPALLISPEEVPVASTPSGLGALFDEPESPRDVTPDDSVNSLSFGYELVPTRRKGTPDPIRVQLELSPANASAGERVTLAIGMRIDAHWSTYGLEKFDETQLENPTEIKLTFENLEATGEWTSVPDPVPHETPLGTLVATSNAHEGFVVWKRELQVQSAAPYGVQGTLTYQICETGKSCLPPNRVAFSLGSPQQSEHLASAMPLSGSLLEVTAASAPTSLIADETQLFQIAEADSVTSLGGALASAFFIGLILNVMPCVLPVLAIKILSFVQQAGESRLRIIALNTSYTLGVMSVFFVMAIISVIIGNSIAGIYQSSGFNAVMAGIVFTMGLSLFGVFELPVPGLIPSAHEDSEGFLGAFNTGIIATLLGTPCIGPFLVPIWGYTLQQPAPIVFLIFGVMGIGMASPYLLTGVFPALVNWLPKPGMWMVKFKQFTGFAMMGTVIWLLFSVKDTWQLPLLVLFLAVGLWVWMMANLSSPTDPVNVQRRTYLFSTIGAAPVFGFGLWLIFGAHLMPWKPFSEAEMIALRQEGEPMIIDFTADWCAICKVNEASALNTKKTVDFVTQHGFTPLLADFTDENPEIKKWLNHFGQETVPLTIVVPPGADSTPIPLRGAYSQGTLLQTLESAIQANTPTTARTEIGMAR